MRTVLTVMLVDAVLGSLANSAPLSEGDLKNLLCRHSAEPKRTGRFSGTKSDPTNEEADP